MDMCVTSKPKNEVSNTEPRLRSAKSEDNAQKENNNAHLTPVSFIPVYTNKSGSRHYFSDKNEECKTLSIDQDQLNTAHPVSPRPRCLVDQNEKFSLRSVRAHIRRRSVGFEDVTSFNSTNDRRSEALGMNSNLTPGSDKACSQMLNSDNGINYGFGRRNQRENNIHISSLNQNSKVVKNANDQMQNLSKPYQHYKDKSSKRKSSLNRMDFVDFPPSYTVGNPLSKNLSYRSKNSSSDEEADTKPQFLSSGSSKRKHNISPGTGSESAQKTFNKALIPNSSPVNKQKLLPKSSQSTHFKFKQHRRAQSVTMQTQKFSHSAGELESLTDDANSTNKICLSAQEFETRDSSLTKSSLRAGIRSNLKKFSSFLPPMKRLGSPMGSSDQDASQQRNAHIHQDGFQCGTNADENKTSQDMCAETIHSKFTKESCESNLSKSHVEELGEPVLNRLNLNDSFELKHIDSKSEDEGEVAENVAKLLNLSISEEKGSECSPRNSDENCDSTCSDGEKRPNSILRKKYNQERKELHSILKPPPEDKQSKAPTSILKHRESSEEKDVWQQSDLHSILKKSTSEDDSCNSGPDIRPILKVSTDEESPVGTARPRPILKKRTSFSEECSFASYQSSELKPILKKKTLLSNEDQPRPILKSRRKSDDARSTLSEFVASRPRAYSADMGVKSKDENKQDGVEQKMEDFCKREPR